MALTLEEIRSYIPELRDKPVNDIVAVMEQHGFDTSAIAQEETAQPEESGLLRSYVGTPILKGIEGANQAIGYGLEASGIAPETGRAMQESADERIRTLTSHQSQQAQEDAQKKLIDENGEYGGYNLGSAAQDLFGSLPGVGAMALPGGLLTKVLTPIAGELVGSSIGFGASEGAFSGAQNASQIQQEIRSADFETLLQHPEFKRTVEQETSPELSMDDRLMIARDIVARKAGDQVFADTFVKTGGISSVTGGGMLGALGRGGYTGGLATRLVKGGAGEWIQETPQSAFEQKTLNQARKDYLDQNQDPNQGVLTAGLEGGLIGFTMGAAGGFKANVEDIAKAPTVDDAIKAASDAVEGGPTWTKPEAKDIKNPWTQPEFKDIPDAEKIVQNRTLPGAPLQDFIDSQYQPSGYTPSEQVWERPNIEQVQGQADKNRAFYEAEQSAIQQKQDDLAAMERNPDASPAQVKQYRKKRIELQLQKRKNAELFRQGLGFNIVPMQAGEVKNDQLSTQLTRALNEQKVTEATGVGTGASLRGLGEGKRIPPIVTRKRRLESLDDGTVGLPSGLPEQDQRAEGSDLLSASRGVAALDEPWKLTKKEWNKLRESVQPNTAQSKITKGTKSQQVNDFNRLEKLIYGVPNDAQKKIKSAQDGYIKLSKDEIDSLMERINTPVTHRDVIQKALTEGKPVPPEVLKDYPDLQNDTPQANQGSLAPQPAAQDANPPAARTPAPNKQGKETAAEGSLKDFTDKKLDKSGYRKAYEEEPDLLVGFKNRAKDEWKEKIESATERLPDHVIDEYIDNYGMESLLARMRGVHEKAIEGWMPKDIRETAILKQTPLPVYQRAIYERTWPQQLAEEKKATPRKLTRWEITKSRNYWLEQINKAEYEKKVIPENVLKSRYLISKKDNVSVMPVSQDANPPAERTPAPSVPEAQAEPMVAPKAEDYKSAAEYHAARLAFKKNQPANNEQQIEKNKRLNELNGEIKKAKSLLEKRQTKGDKAFSPAQARLDAKLIKEAEDKLTWLEDERNKLVSPQLDSILTVSKKRYLSDQKRAYNKANPNAIKSAKDKAYADMERAYDDDLLKAEVSLPFEQYRQRNPDLTENLARQTYDQVRGELGLNEKRTADLPVQETPLDEQAVVQSEKVLPAGAGTEKVPEANTEATEIKASDDKSESQLNKPKPKQSAINDKDDLLAAIAKLGGLKRDEAKAQGIDPASFNKRGYGIMRVFTKGGKSYDEMAELLRGYYFDAPTANDLVDQVSRAINQGEKIYTPVGYEIKAELMEQERLSDEEARRVINYQSLLETAKQHDADFGTNYLDILLAKEDMDYDDINAWEEDFYNDRQERIKESLADSETALSSYTEQDIKDREQADRQRIKQEETDRIKSQADKEFDSVFDEMAGTAPKTQDVFGMADPLEKVSEPEEKPEAAKKSQTQRKGGLTKVQVLDHIAKKYRKLKPLVDNGTVVVYDTFEDVPVEIRGDGMASSQNPVKIEGFTYKGKIYLIADALSPETIDGVIHHEFFHKVIAENPKIRNRLLGAQSDLRGIMRQVEAGRYRGRYKEIYDAAMNRAKKAGFASEQEKLEEFLAYSVSKYLENPQSLPERLARIIKDIIAAIKLAVFKMTGKITDISPADLTAMARSSMRVSEDGGGGMKSSKLALPDKITIDGVERWTVNSNGQSIAQTEEGIRNFWKWFGDSKVVDDQGRPLVVYHGTDKKFNKINFKKSYQPIFWFSSDKEKILSGDAGAKATSVLMELYVKLDSPANRKQYNDLTLSEYKGRGLDGAILEGGNGFVMNQSQIKSATGNAGAFDPNNNDIRYSLAEDTTREELNRRIREQHKTVSDRAKQWFTREFHPGGALPKAVFTLKVARDSEINAEELIAHNLVAMLDKSVKAAWGGRMTEEQKQLVGARLKGEEVSLPASVKDSIDAMRLHIDKLSARYADILFKEAKELQAADKTEAAAAKVQLLNTIANNIGSYVNRSYRAFDNENWAKQVPDDVLNNARDYLEDRFRSKGSVTPIVDAQRTINDILKTGTAYDTFEQYIRESKLGAKDLSVLIKRKDIAPEIRALLGEYTDPRINFVKSATKMSRLIFNDDFLKQVKTTGLGADGFLFTKDNRPADEHTVKIAADSSSPMAPLNGLYTYPEINQAFVDALNKESMESWYRMIVQANGLIKWGKTILSPTTSFRNWMSAYFFTLANGHFDLSHMKESIESFKTYFDQDNGRLHYLEKLKRLGVIYDTPYAGEMMALLADSKFESALMGEDGRFSKAKLKVKDWMDLATKFYQFGDDFWKIIGFENEKQILKKYRGLTDAQAEVEAAKRIRNTYPTYSMVGRMIQKLRRFPLVGTFVSFPAEIIRTSFNILKYAKEDMAYSKELGMRRIAGIAMVSGFAYAAQALAMSLTGTDDHDEEALRDLAPPWSKNSNIIPMGRDKNGSLIYIDMSFLDPYNYFKRPLNAILRGQSIDETAYEIGREILTPFFGQDIAFGAISDIWQNKKDSGGQVFNPNDSALNIGVDIANHLRKNLQPGIVSNMERMTYALTGHKSTSGQTNTVAEELAALAGFRASRVNPKVALYYRSYEFQDKLKDASKILNDVARDPNRVSDSRLKSAYERAIETRSEAFKDMHELVSSAENAGLSKAAIRKLLKLNHVSQKNINFILLGKEPKWVPGETFLKSSIAKSDELFDAETTKEFERRRKLILSGKE